jgi:pyrroline-5-carboxylate reductase
MDKTITFIGCGNIASAMIRGIVKGNVVPAGNITASDKAWRNWPQ